MPRPFLCSYSVWLDGSILMVSNFRFIIIKAAVLQVFRNGLYSCPDLFFTTSEPHVITDVYKEFIGLHGSVYDMQSKFLHLM